METLLNSIVVKSNIREKIDTKSESFKWLVKDIEVNGIIQPLVVHQEKDKSILISGHRRYEAAKKLNLTKVPIHIRPKPNGDLKAIQISENIHREDLTPYEEIIAFKDMVAGEKSVKMASEKYGCSESYVRQRLHLANLIPPFLQPDIINDNSTTRDMLELASVHPDVQKEALKWAKGTSKKTDKSWVKHYYEVRPHNFKNPADYYDLNRNKIEFDEFVKLFGSVETVRELEKEFGVKTSKTLGLFDEFLDDTYCNDPEFIKFALKSRYPHTSKVLESLPTINRDDLWRDMDVKRVSYATFFTAVKDDHELVEKSIAKVNLSEYPYYLIIKYKNNKVEETKKDKIERGKYYGQVKKFAKVTIPAYVEYLKVAYWMATTPLTRVSKLGSSDKKNNTETYNNIFKYIYGQHMELNEISKHEFTVGFGLQKIFNSFKKIESEKDISTYTINTIVDSLVLETIYQSSINDLNKFAKILGVMSYKDWFLTEWKTDEDITEWKTNVFNCFTTKNLSNRIHKGKKSDIVQYAVNENIDFCFKDIFTSKDNDWRELWVKQNYLDKGTLYVLPLEPTIEKS